MIWLFETDTNVKCTQLKDCTIVYEGLKVKIIKDYFFRTRYCVGYLPKRR